MERETSPDPGGWYVEARTTDDGGVEVRCARTDAETGRTRYLSRRRLARQPGPLGRWWGASLERRTRRAVAAAQRECLAVNQAEASARRLVAAWERGGNG